MMDKRIHGRRFVLAVTGLIFCVTAAVAQDVNIEKGLPYVNTLHEGKVVKIQRVQNQNHILTGGFAKTSRKCPPFCIQPMQVAPGVKTAGELEVLTFIERRLNRGKGVLIDARTASWHKRGTIPGSINIPFTSFGADQDETVKAAALLKLGVRKKSGESFVDSTWDRLQGLMGNASARSQWDFTHAKELMIWCNGMWCGQSPHAIHALLKLGYPAEKINYYRGGMQAWKILGLTVVVPQS